MADSPALGAETLGRPQVRERRQARVGADGAHQQTFAQTALDQRGAPALRDGDAGQVHSSAWTGRDRDRQVRRAWVVGGQRCDQARARRRDHLQGVIALTSSSFLFFGAPSRRHATLASSIFGRPHPSSQTGLPSPTLF